MSRPAISSRPGAPWHQLPSLLTMLLASALGLSSMPAQAQWSLITGLDYSSGTYGGTSRTDVLTAPLALRYISGPWTLRVGTSWMQITGDGSAVPVLGSAIDTGNSGSNRSGSGTGSSASTSGASLVNSGTIRTRRTDAGYGDVVISAIYTAYDNEDSGTAVDLAGSVKLGTADASRGLGTGYNDYSLKATVFKDIGAWGLFATAGHKLIGTAPGDPARSQSFGALGMSYRFDKTHSAGMALDFASASSPGGSKPLEASIYYRYRFGKASRLNVELVRGLSNASPSMAAAITLTWAFD